MNSGSTASSALMRGSTRVALAYANGGDHANSATVATVLLLDAGEVIYAEHRGGTLHDLSPDHYTYLAGFLIQKQIKRMKIWFINVNNIKTVLGIDSAYKIVAYFSVDFNVLPHILPQALIPL